MSTSQPTSATPPAERLVMTRVLGRSEDGAYVAVAVAPINRWTSNGQQREDWAAYVGVAPAGEVPDRRADAPLTPSLEWIQSNGRKLLREAAASIFGYSADTYRD